MSSTPVQIKADSSEFSIAAVRADFPLLRREVNGKPLIYADNAATTQKPQVVIDRIKHYYEFENANIHRGVHTLSAEATEAYEDARENVRQFMNARDTQEIIFTRGTTEAINLVAQSWARSELKPGDEILISELEHHSNIVPWQMVCQQTGAVLKVAPINEAGEIVVESYTECLNDRTRLVAVGHISNALGTVNPIASMISAAHDVGARVLIDGAQASIHTALDMQALDCDFYAFSGHKALGPTGIGVLYGRAELLDQMPPWQGGGDMIKVVTLERTEYNTLPYKFEAGTPNIAGGLGLGAALDYFMKLDLTAVMAHEDALLKAATERALAIPQLTIVGTAAHKAAVVSFNVEGVHPHDLGTLLDHQGIAIRTGHHCAMPVMAKFGLSGTARVSFALYNTLDDVRAAFDGIEKVLPMLLD